MKITNKINIILILLFFSFETVKAKINNDIIVKVGNNIITSIDLENEVKTLLFINKKPLSQSNINAIQKIAIKNLITQIIKKNEIEKYDITEYNSNDLENYLSNISKLLNIPRNELKKYFTINNLDYNHFIITQKTSLKWNTLIYSFYRNQININTVEVENDLEKKLKDTNDKKEYNLAEIEVPITKDINKTVNSIYEDIEINNFYEVAKKISISPSALDGGKIGWFSEDILSSIYKSAIQNLKNGEISKPIKGQESIIILKLINTKIVKNDKRNIEQIKDEIVKNKKIKKLELFSKSHYTKLYNSTLISYNDK